MTWGRSKENGVWLVAKSRHKILWRGHDSLFVAVWRLRIRLMKPGMSA